MSVMKADVQVALDMYMQGVTMHAGMSGTCALLHFVDN